MAVFTERVFLIFDWVWYVYLKKKYSNIFDSVKGNFQNQWLKMPF